MHRRLPEDNVDLDGDRVRRDRLDDLSAGRPDRLPPVFRQFNVVGAGAHPYAVDAAPAGLLPAIFRAASGGADLVVRGRDYPTRDGSAVRDFVDVTRIAASGICTGRRAGIGSSIWGPARERPSST